MEKIRIIVVTMALGALLLVHIDTLSRQTEGVQKNVSKQVVRFHVLANSDSEFDQKQKLQVRDQVVSYLQDKLKNADSKELAKGIIRRNLDQIKQIAEKTLLENGNQERVTARLTTESFPVKLYGDTVFPAGRYETLQVEIGEGQGHNWWCVLYPSLCFVDESLAVVPEESKKKLEASIGEEDFKMVTDEKMKYRFKVVEWWGKLKNTIE